MLLFGHLGITLGVFLGLGILIPRLRAVTDPRYLVIGALLPDLIDKPIGGVIFASTLSNGRIIGHTLFLAFLLFLIGLYLYEKKRDIKTLTLALGSFFHLLEDKMWAQPPTFFWPLLGLGFPKDSSDYNGIDYLIKMLEKSFEPEFSQSFATEIMGIVIMAIFTAQRFKKRSDKKSSGEIKNP